MNSAAAEGARRRRFRFQLGATLVTLAGVALLVGLGTWQLQRLSWKEGLIAAAQAQLAQPPRELTPDIPLDGTDYRHLTAHGRYLHDRSFAFGLAANGNEPGALLVTPFALDDGRVILVDRGWLPERLLPPRVPAGLQPEGERTLTGVTRWRPAPLRNFMTPADEPERRRWFAWDLAAMADAVDLPLLPVVLTLDASDGPEGQSLPKPEPVTPEFRNDHLGYAITWFSLAAGLIGVYLLSSLHREDDRPS